MATVYLARDLKHGRPVALKVLYREVAASVGSERFLREIQFMARLTHPHILPLLDSGEAAGLLYYSMPYVEGESLRAKLAREGRLPLADAARIAREVADALDYAHRHEILHRDIKPENILLEESHAVVADFGIARAISLAESGGATTSGLILGTPVYMSPEQGLGQADLDGRSDLYSLACVVYEMLVGEPPVRGPSAQAVLARKCTQDAPRLRAVLPDVPDAVDESLARALARVPTDRFPTATEFAHALERGAPGTSAPTKGPIPFSGRRLRRLGTALALVLLSVGVAFLGLRAVGMEETPGLDARRVAVAVFANRTGDASLESLGVMAADWIIRGLTQTGLIDVVDLGTVLVQGRTSRGELVDPRQLARQNGAYLVVWGNYYGTADSLVVQASVIDVEKGTVVQALEPVQVPSKVPTSALEGLQDRVMGVMATVLDPRFANWTGKASKAPSYEAYRSYIAGQNTYWSGGSPVESSRHFREALVQDSTFLTAAVWLAFVGANGGGCSLTDSLAVVLIPQRAALTPFDRLTLDISVARCRNDWQEAYRLAGEQAALKPRTAYAIYTAGFFAVATNHLRAGRDLLRRLDPARDLGWISDPAKAIYWRDLMGAEHLLGDHRAELRLAERQLKEFPGRLTIHLSAIRALAGLGRGKEALARLEEAMQLPDDSVARVQGGMTPGHFAYQAAMELRVHGDTRRSRAAAERAVAWYEAEAGSRLERGRFERQFLARSLLLLDRPDRAMEAVSVGGDTTDILLLSFMGVVAARQGRREQAREVDRRLATLTEPALRGVADLQRIRVKLALGERDSAFAMLERVAEEGRVLRAPLGNDMHCDPLYDQMRGDERFERINRGD